MMAKSTSVCAQIFVAADHLRPFAADSVIHWDSFNKGTGAQLGACIGGIWSNYSFGR